MARLVWGDGPRPYDQGLDRGVLYLADTAVPWNGLVSVGETAGSSVDVDHYFDGNRVWVSQMTDDFAATVAAYTYPEAFSAYNGYSPEGTRERFGLSYRTQQGDGYLLHIVYDGRVDSKEKAASTLSKTIDPALFQWGLSAVPVPIPDTKPASRLILDATSGHPAIAVVEDMLYGTDTVAPRLPDPAELYELYESYTVFRVVFDKSSGTFTVTGPDNMIFDRPDGLFDLYSPSVFLGENGLFTVSSI